ncbi:MAG: hypothetical protein ACOY31_11210 [Bacillota bacterium]
MNKKLLFIMLLCLVLLVFLIYKYQEQRSLPVLNKANTGENQYTNRSWQKNSADITTGRSERPQPKQVVIQRGNHIYPPLKNISSEEPIISDIQNLRWIAYRGGAGMNFRQVVKDQKDISIVKASETIESNGKAQDGSRWVRLYYGPYKPVQGVNDIGHKDIIIYADNSQDPEDAYLLIQNPDILTEWTVITLPGYGQWLQKEIDMLLRMKMGL